MGVRRIFKQWWHETLIGKTWETMSKATEFIFYPILISFYSANYLKDAERTVYTSRLKSFKICCPEIANISQKKQ